MANELKSQLSIGGDASGAVGAVETTKKSLKTLGPAAAAAGKEAAAGVNAVGDAAQPAAAKVDASTRNIIGSIERQIALTQAGARSGADYYRALAGQRGVDLAVLKPYLDQLDAVTAKQKAAQAAIQSSAPALDRVGVSAAQTAAALRGVPAQFTDIAVSLQGGQAPLTVFLQQGGQLKDMFGGAGPAARALGGYVMGLINPFTLAAAAAATLGLAYYQGSKEASNYTKALILSGNAAGTTAGQLSDMAAAIAVGNRGLTQGAAASSLAILAESGAVGAASLQRYAEAAASFERAAGQSVTKTAEVFKDLERAPLEASVKLNEQIHHLTITTYEHIKSLQDQGRYTDAARAAQDAYATALASRSTMLVQNLGYVETAWRGVIDGAKRGWDAMLGVGRASTGSEQLTALRKQLADIEAERWKFTGGGQSGMDAYDKRTSALKAQIGYMERVNASLGAQAAAEAASTKQTEARARWEKEGDQYLSNKEKREQAIAKVRAEGLAAGVSEAEIQHRIVDITQKLKDEKTKVYTDPAATKYLETLQQQGAALGAQLTSAGKMTDAERERAKFLKLIDDLSGKSRLTDEQKSLVASQEKIKAQLAVNVSLEREVGFQKILADDTKRRADALKATETTVEGIRRSIEQAAQQQREQYDDRLGVLGLGSEAAEQVRAREQIRRQYAKFDKQLTDEAAKNRELESDAYKQGAAKIQSALESALAASTSYYDTLKEKQSDWSLGASQALANYRDESQNAFKQGERFANMAFTSIEDQLVNLYQTGKFSARTIGDAFVAEFIRVEARAAISSVFGKSGGTSLFGSLFSAGVGLLGSSYTAAFSQTSLGASGFGSGLAYGNQDLGLSFDGGGYTGDGERTGGVDGKGGFTAVLHPRESVVDHTKGQSMGWGAPTIINNTTGRVDRASVSTGQDGRMQITLEEVAAALDDPNSRLSKSYQRNYNAQRKR